MRARVGPRSVWLAAAILLLFGTLVLLVGSLDQLTFHPGKHLARNAEPDEQTLTVEGSTATLTKKEKIYVTILGGLTGVSLICVFIFRKLRRQLIQYLFTLFSLVLPMLLGLFLVSRFLANWLSKPSDGTAVAGTPEIPEAILSNPPSWSVAVAAAALAVVLLGTIALLAWRWTTLRDRIRGVRLEASMDLDAEQRAIANQAAVTAQRIRDGEPLHGEVIRCYREMDRLLSKRRRLKPTYLTPREFANALDDLGIRSEHIEQLTHLFELVRYGNRADESLAQQALTCLDRLRFTYGGEDPHAHAEA